MQTYPTSEGDVSLPSPLTGFAVDVSPNSQEVSAGVSLQTVVEDFGKSFVQSAIVSPLWNGVGQLVSGGQLPVVSIVNDENAQKSKADYWAQQIGGALGMAADFYVLNKLKIRFSGQAHTGENVKNLSLWKRSCVQAKEGAKLGAIYGAILTPSDPNGDLLLGRLHNAGVQAVSFGIMSSNTEVDPEIWATS